MKVYEFGKEHTGIFAKFQCAVEPWRVFKASAEEMAKDFHVYLFIADGHDELGTEFVSLEKYVKDAAEYLRSKGISRVDAMYGISMGGAAVIRFLATEGIPVEKAIIDAGITPYPYPKLICRLISVKDWIMIMLATRSLQMMKLACPPALDAQRRGSKDALPGFAEILSAALFAADDLQRLLVHGQLLHAGSDPAGGHENRILVRRGRKTGKRKIRTFSLIKPSA